MSSRKRSAIAAAVVLLLGPAAVTAQNAPPQAPEVRYLSVTRFQVPQGSEDRGKVMMFIDSMMVPLARMNPNVLSFHAATHNWGANSNDVVLIYEYPSWAAIEAECAACDRWATEREPKEGTPERKKWDDISAAFGRHYSGHADEIYAVPVTRSKIR